ncbi:protein kinase domain protein [Ichthyophthirius multifiliis]|uniref:non-specific serine/threonine protein kinase n=1 Tax=Ichthyophthirius multifiliis TaxID=5932 RepID=G0QVK4_ICHMU|nr:protein kinase domain protein [Ichthyophthirius multifiliis]EGR30764.1 protein kinase domain protein [Ichthyophthirius multifiliis]|eukprot:XP_004032351.1 protein kinase domain protein [Ichthyophthirius multifiliis]
MEVYETIKLIGSGAFGQVYMVRHMREDKLYVIKKIKTRDMCQKDRENTENEVRLLQKLRHSNIVAYKDSYMDREQYLNIVMIHCEGGDMHNKIQNQKGKHFPENQILDWLAQMALALYYLHDKKILHRDLKTQNIFLKHGRVRLGDFGIAKVLDSTRDFANTCIGTPYYMSPELFKYKPYSYKSDVWAFGCVLYEMCNLRHAFDAQSLNGLAVKIMKGSYPPINSSYSWGLRDLIGKMLQLVPNNRPSIIEILNKPFVKKRVFQYMCEIFSGQYPEVCLPNDIDDIYQDSLKDQAYKLNLMEIIQQQIQNGNGISALDFDDQSQKRPPKRQGQRAFLEKKVQKDKEELKKQIDEKLKIEKQIKKLEDKKYSQNNKKRQQQQILSKEKIPVNQKNKQISNNNFQQLQNQKKKKNQNEDFSLDLIERESFDQKNGSTSKLSEGEDDEQKSQDQVILEEDNEESEYEEIDAKIELMKTKLKEKTIKINTLKESLKANNKEYHINVEEEENNDKIIEEEENIYYENEGNNDEQEEEDEEDYTFNEEECEENINEDEKINYNPQYYKIQDRIKLFIHRCEAGLGNVIYEKAYDFVKYNQQNTSVEDMRTKLVQILQADNIGFWHLVDQIIFLEELLLTIPQVLK